MLLIRENEQKSFRFAIEVNGTELENTSARLVFEDINSNKFFPLHINSDGSCEYQLDYAAVKSLSEGRVYLEVVAESMLFKPWEEEFRIESQVPEIRVTESVIETQTTEHISTTTPKPVTKPATKKPVVETVKKPIVEEKQTVVETIEPIMPAMYKELVTEFKQLMKQKRASLILGETAENRAKKKEAIKELYLKHGKSAMEALDLITRTTIDELLIL